MVSSQEDNKKQQIKRKLKKENSKQQILRGSTKATVFL